MKWAVVVLLCSAFAVTLLIHAAPASSAGHAQIAKKKCKKSKKAAVAKKKKCKKKAVPVAPAVPTPAGAGGTTTPPPPADADGDGIGDSIDNCVNHPNPGQEDTDNDGEGDACDPCPNDADTSFCSGPDPNDTDADGVVNTVDNCPANSNSDQADMDGDGKGDVCDPCPSAPNAGAAGCPTTIYEINDGTEPPGSYVRITNALVTAKMADGSAIWVQIESTDPGTTGSTAYAGLEVSTSVVSLAGISVGNRVTIDGTSGTQSLTAAAITLLTATTEPVEYAGSTAAAFGLGTQSAALNGHYTDITTPTTVTSQAGGEWVTSAGFTVGKRIIGTLPTCGTGDTLNSLFGIADLVGGNLVLLPRSSSDVVCMPTLTDLTTDTDICIGTNNNAATVTLSSAPPSDTFVTVSSDDTSKITVPEGGVTVLSGQTSATLSLNGEASGGPVTITASLNGVEKTSQTSVTC